MRPPRGRKPLTACEPGSERRYRFHARMLSVKARRGAAASTDNWEGLSFCLAHAASWKPWPPMLLSRVQQQVQQQGSPAYISCLDRRRRVGKKDDLVAEVGSLDKHGIYRTKFCPRGIVLVAQASSIGQDGRVVKALRLGPAWSTE